MKLLHHFVGLPRIWADTTRVLALLRVQKRYLKQHIQPVITNAIQNGSNRIDQDDIDKINNYYGLAVPAILESPSAYSGENR